jgi:hypothetical protein
MAKTDLQTMREKLQKNLGWTKEEMEQDVIWRELSKPAEVSVDTLIKNVRERSKLREELKRKGIDPDAE